MDLPGNTRYSSRPKRGRSSLIAAAVALVLVIGALWALLSGELTDWLGASRTDRGASSASTDRSSRAAFRMYMFHIYSNRGTCEVQISFSNRSAQIIDEFSADIVGTLDYGKREVARFSVNYVDPGKSVDATVKFFSSCDDRTEFELRGAVRCRSNGQLYRGCHKLLEIETSKSSWTLSNQLRD